jgi:hypothetical protein
MTIWGRYQDGPAEKVDTCAKRSAAYLLREYRMAFGAGWKLWVGLKREEPGRSDGDSGQPVRGGVACESIDVLCERLNA